MGSEAGSKQLVDLLEEINDEVGDDDQVGFRDLLRAFGSRAFGPLIAAVGLVALTPIGAIPTVPTVLAVLVLLISGQHLVGRDHPWFPKKLLDRSVDAERWEKGYEKAKPWAEKIDRFIKPRLTRLTASPMDRLASGMAVVIAGMMVPLELLPFAVVAPAVALVCLGVSLTARDGVLFLVGSAAAVGCGYLVFVAVG